MNLLNALPQELFLFVAEQLTPLEEFNLAITSRQSWNSLRSRIQKHHELSQIHRKHRISYNGLTAWKALDNLIVAPHLGQYIKRVDLRARIGNYRPESIVIPENPATTNDQDQPPARDVARWSNTIRDHPLLAKVANTYDVLDSESSIREGHDILILAGLLSFTPNITRLMLSIDSEDGAMREFVMSAADELSKYNHLNQAIPSWLPFQHLKEVWLQCHDDLLGDVNGSWILCFALIPTVKFIRADHVRQRELDPFVAHLGRHWEGQAIKRTSNLTDLILDSASLIKIEYTRIISSICGLEKFHYVNDAQLYDGGSFDSVQLIQALFHYQSSTLKHLWIWDDETPDGIAEPILNQHDFVKKLTSLRARQKFASLQHLSCCWTDIVRAGYAGVGLLGPALETVTIWNCPKEQYELIFEVLDTLPNLRAVRLATTYDDWEIPPEVEAYLQRRKVKWLGEDAFYELHESLVQDDMDSFDGTEDAEDTEDEDDFSNDDDDDENDDHEMGEDDWSDAE